MKRSSALRPVVGARGMASAPVESAVSLIVVVQEGSSLVLSLWNASRFTV